VPIWKRLAHPSIAAFRGVNTETFQLALVYDLAENGNIINYLQGHPGAPRLTLVMILLLYDIVRLTTLPGYSCCKSYRV